MTEPSDTELAVRELFAAFERLGAVRRQRLGLTMSEEVVLRLIGQGTAAPSELSRVIGMTTAGMTSLLDRLEKDELVRREPHRTDKRRILLSLTKLGFRTQLELEELHADLADLAGRSDAEVVRSFLTDAVSLMDARANGAGTSSAP